MKLAITNPMLTNPKVISSIIGNAIKNVNGVYWYAQCYTDNENYYSLKKSVCAIANHFSKENGETGNWGNKNFFHEAEFFIPYHGYAHEHSCKKQGLTNYAWQNNLLIA